MDKSNWIGRGVVFPRSGYPESKSRQELGKTGVCVIWGRSEETGRDRAYIGEGDPVRPRLDSLFVKKDFWTQGFAFISKDDNLNTALCELAAAASHSCHSRAR